MEWFFSFFCVDRQSKLAEFIWILFTCNSLSKEMNEKSQKHQTCMDIDVHE